MMNRDPGPSFSRTTRSPPRRCTPPQAAFVDRPTRDHLTQSTLPARHPHPHCSYRPLKKTDLETDVALSRTIRPSSPTFRSAPHTARHHRYLTREHRRQIALTTHQLRQPCVFDPCKSSDRVLVINLSRALRPHRRRQIPDRPARQTQRHSPPPRLTTRQQHRSHMGKFSTKTDR